MFVEIEDLDGKYKSINHRFDSAYYLNYYSLLKAQRTILQQLISNYKGSKDESICNIIKVTQKLLNSSYVNLFTASEEGIEYLQYFTSIIQDSDASLLASKLIKPFFIIKSIQSILQQPDEFDDQPMVAVESDCRTRNVLCRVCENYIPLEQISSHLENCVQTFNEIKSEKDIDIMIRDFISENNKTYLANSCPGDEIPAKTTILPVLHLNTLLSTLVNENIQLSSSYIRRINTKIKRLSIRNVDNHIVHELSMRAAKLSFEKERIVKAKQIPIRADTITINDFEFLKRLSNGAYGRVYLARKKTTGEVFAIKAIPRHQMDHQNTAFNEKMTLSQVSSSSVVSMYYSIAGVKNMYIVMEYLPGGDLSRLLDNVGSFSEDVIRAYAAQIVMALADLRKFGIIHRDLKPGNILVNKNGQLKLIDFGLSYTGASERCVRLVGTPDYLSPEVILNMAHSFSVDYWSLGAMLYEFFEGVPPFHGETAEETILNICKGKIPRIQCSNALWNLIKGLMDHNSKKRLGAKSIEEIMHHPFFKGIDWKHVHKIVPPFVPALRNEFDTSYFDTNPESGDGKQNNAALGSMAKNEDMSDIIYDCQNSVKMACDHKNAVDGKDNGLFHYVSITELVRITINDAERLKMENLMLGKPRARARRHSERRIQSVSPIPIAIKCPIVPV